MMRKMDVNAQELTPFPRATNEMSRMIRTHPRTIASNGVHKYTTVMIRVHAVNIDELLTRLAIRG